MYYKGLCGRAYVPLEASSSYNINRIKSNTSTRIAEPRQKTALLDKFHPLHAPPGQGTEKHSALEGWLIRLCRSLQLALTDLAFLAWSPLFSCFLKDSYEVGSMPHKHSVHLPYIIKSFFLLQ